ncbi:PA4642 family protein [Chromatocurvus halotolerans]|uniref:Uncharacterized protein n=1 Tax=Chromatocurvus halotolerans TaxID=1132028 RepID=A0A4R2KRE0_9GAMM|nr:PA4642 family protein [Chromatocurvus halotolerans]TCO76244.1 hypothetical protein EV688_105206 [Chromatocurvus halotolerans]
MRKDKEKVLDEVWDDARVRSFLDVRSHSGDSDDFHCLLRAYQSMREGDFRRFLVFFTADGRDVNATSAAGETVLSIVKEHRLGGGFAAALVEFGAS